MYTTPIKSLPENSYYSSIEELLDDDEMMMDVKTRDMRYLEIYLSYPRTEVELTYIVSDMVQYDWEDGFDYSIKHPNFNINYYDDDLFYGCADALLGGMMHSEHYIKYTKKLLNTFTIDRRVLDDALNSICHYGMRDDRVTFLLDMYPSDHRFCSDFLSVASKSCNETTNVLYILLNDHRMNTSINIEGALKNLKSHMKYYDGMNSHYDERLELLNNCIARNHQLTI